MSPELGARVIAEARKHIGAHYINGAYGATPDKEDGCPCRPGMVSLIKSHDRLDPTWNLKAETNIAVYAAQMTIKKHCVCAGNYNSFPGGRHAHPKDMDLNTYLEKLKKIPDPDKWPYFVDNYTPRRAFGPGPGGDIGGTLVWGQGCADIRHFDCIGFISYCLWAAGGPVAQHEISGWRAYPKPPEILTKNPMGATVYDYTDLKGLRTKELQDGDIIIKADHHIAWVAKDGTIIEAQDTDVGVRSTGKFSPSAPGEWTHLVRLPASMGGRILPNAG